MHRILLALAVLSSAGCGTLSNLGVLCPCSVHPRQFDLYGGARYDLSEIQQAFTKREKIGAIIPAADLPLSAAADTLFLPVTLLHGAGKFLNSIPRPGHEYLVEAQ
jgi:uncharacterized protein YceK